MKSLKRWANFPKGLRKVDTNLPKGNEDRNHLINPVNEKKINRKFIKKAQWKKKRRAEEEKKGKGEKLI